MLPTLPAQCDGRFSADHGWRARSVAADDLAGPDEFSRRRRLDWADPSALHVEPRPAPVSSLRLVAMIENKHIAKKIGLLSIVAALAPNRRLPNATQTAHLPGGPGMMLH